jgi:hypothetical protein
MGIAISFLTYSVTFDKFTDENLPRTYLEEGTIDYSLAGTTIVGGPNRVSKRTWAISAILHETDAKELEAMYRSWMSSKVTGNSFVVNLVDETFTNDTISAGVLFSVAPTFTKFSPNSWLCSVGLVEG